MVVESGRSHSVQIVTSLRSGSYDHTVKIWDVHSGECLQTLPGHPGCMLAIAFSPDGKTLISNSAVARMKQSIAGILPQGNAGQLYGQPIPMKA
ncbi:WD40 repeat domain-containing protein [Nostoc sp.]|uniref:WD40 repeat domain-containing protein n=1 Tax=Nostoc sp. TaxID=1180 RepID=UPI002FF6BAB4